MNPETITLLLPSQLLPCIEKYPTLRREVSILLLLKAIYPEGRIILNHVSIGGKKQRKTTHLQEAATRCGFDTMRGFTNNLKALEKHGLVTRSIQEGKEYAAFASWEKIKQHFKYERNHFRTYVVSAITYRDVINLVIASAWQRTKQDFYHALKARIKGDTILRDLIETVCGSTSVRHIAHCQLKLYCEGLPPSLTDDELFCFKEFLHGMVAPSSASDETAKRFYIKGDTEVSTGYMSYALGYARKNGICYRKAQMMQKGIITITRREYELAPGVRTTGKQRTTGIGNTYIDRRTDTLVLHLCDAITFNNPSTVFTQPKPTPADAKI